MRSLLVAAMAAATAACHQAPVQAQAQAETFSVDGSRINVEHMTVRPGAGRAAGERQITSLLNVPEQMKYGDYVWHEEGAAAGPAWVLVDLKAQTISVFRAGDEIGTAVALYGVDDKPTPTGRFAVLRKDKDYWSRTYNAPMPYSLWLTEDGVAIHGSDVREGAGTHGCVGVPLDFGRHLFETMKAGGEVLIVRDVAGKSETVRGA